MSALFQQRPEAHGPRSRRSRADARAFRNIFVVYTNLAHFLGLGCPSPLHWPGRRTAQTIDQSVLVIRAVSDEKTVLAYGNQKKLGDEFLRGVWKDKNDWITHWFLQMKKLTMKGKSTVRLGLGCRFNNYIHRFNPTWSGTATAELQNSQIHPWFRTYILRTTHPQKWCDEPNLMCWSIDAYTTIWPRVN